MSKGAKVGSLAVLAVAGVLSIVALATDYWFKIDSLDANGGLWRVCVQGQCASFDTNFKFGNDAEVKLDAARGLSILVLILIVPSLALLATSLHPAYGSSRLPTIAAVLLILQLIFQAGAVGAGAAWIKGSGGDVSLIDFGWSFILAAILVAFHLVSAILACIAQAGARASVGVPYVAA